MWSQLYLYKSAYPGIACVPSHMGRSYTKHSGRGCTDLAIVEQLKQYNTCLDKALRKLFVIFLKALF